jgi:hypothetical protein
MASKRKRYTPPRRFHSCVFTYLTAEDGKTVRAEAKRRKVSIAALLRELIAPQLATFERP